MVQGSATVIVWFLLLREISATNHVAIVAPHFLTLQENSRMCEDIRAEKIFITPTLSSPVLTIHMGGFVTSPEGEHHYKKK
jgi:hypothetical protein